jgi:predicted acylesterase/phospholipase RssA
MFPPGPDQVKQALGVMEESWARLADTKDVWYLRFPPYLAGLWNNSIGNNAPLRKLLTEVVDIDAIRTSGVELQLCACDLLSGELHVFGNDGPVIEATLASSSFPIAFPLEPIGDGLYTDAGVVDIAPAKNAVDAGCDRLLILLSRDPDQVEPIGADKLKTVMQRTERELDLMLTEIIKGDISLCRFINQLVRTGKTQHLGEPYSSYRDMPIDILFPSKPLGSSLRFDRSVMLKQMDQGYKDAKAYFGG